MDFAKMTLEDFFAELGSNSPAPGGGTASAVAGAMGLALVEMVARLTLKSKKCAEFHELAQGVIDEAIDLRAEFLRLATEDSEAFQRYFASKSDADLAACIAVPESVQRGARRGLELAKSLEGRSNKNASSDLKVAISALETAAYGAQCNIDINQGA
jgi:formiminotetrahydrofolate cyclodeaminase